MSADGRRLSRGRGLRTGGAIGAAVAVLIACPAMAAPLYTPPAIIPVASWTGFYVGANAGGNWTQNSPTTISSTPTLVIPLNVFGVRVFNGYTIGGSGALPGNASGHFFGGGQAGYNYQFTRVVLGMEADFQGIFGSHGSNGAFSRTNVSQFGLPGTVFSSLAAQTSLDSLGTVRGRLGGLLTPTLLAYGTGGLAYGHVHSSVDIEQTAASINVPGLEPSSSSGVFSQTRAGWTVGGGVEWMFVSNLMVKLEYLHYDLGSATYSAGMRTTNQFTVPVWQFSSTATTNFRGDLIRVGLNYKFDWAH
jgi:outer membrane immunogenic protein